MRINFYLKEKNTDSETNILISFHYNNNRLLYHTGIKIKPNQWNSKKQFIFAGVKNTTKLNNRLKLLKNLIETEYDNQISKGVIPEKEYLKSFLDEKFKGKKVKPLGEKHKTFYDYFNEFIESKQNLVKRRTIQKYSSLLNHLKDIEKHYNIKFSLNSFTKQFYLKFINYFVDLEHENRTIKEKHVETMNTVLNWFVSMEYINKNNFSGIKFPFKIPPASTIALNENELNELFSFDLTLNKRLKHVRDVFCLQCYTGLRYSDINKITKNSKQGYIVQLFTEKGNDKLTIPLRHEALTIIDSYFDNDLPLPVISSQKMNNYIKEIGELIGFDTPVTVLKLSGINKTETIKKKYELLSSHVGRRTFITLNINKGMVRENIMKITGHSKYETMSKYYRMSEAEAHKEYFDLWDKIQIKHTPTEIIKNLLFKKVPIKTISFAFGIDIDEIKKLIE